MALTLICALIYLTYTSIDKNYIFLFKFNFVYSNFICALIIVPYVYSFIILFIIY